MMSGGSGAVKPMGVRPSAMSRPSQGVRDRAVFRAAVRVSAGGWRRSGTGSTHSPLASSRRRGG